METQVKRINAIFPWFKGLNSDLLFFVAVNTLFFTVVKGLSAFEISLLSTVSLVVCLVFQRLTLKLIKKIGNIASMRVGTGMLICASLLLTFGNNLLILIIGYIFYEGSWFFKSVESVILKNNLIADNREKEYMKIKSKGSMIYAVVTAIIALVSGALFNIDHYLPMYMCILVCIFCFLLSFYIKEFDVEKKQNKTSKKKEHFIKLGGIIWLVIITFAIFYTSLNLGQGNSKLLMQYTLTDNIGISKAATYLSVIIAISRIVRVVGNIVFSKVYYKFKDKICYILSLILLLAFCSIILGFFVNSTIIVKIIFMSLGFFCFLAIRDPFNNYIQELILRVSKKDIQETAIYYLEVVKKLFSAAIKIAITMMLSKYDLMYAIIILGICSAIEVIMAIRLYCLILNQKKEKVVEYELNSEEN